MKKRLLFISIVLTFGAILTGCNQKSMPGNQLPEPTLAPTAIPTPTATTEPTVRPIAGISNIDAESAILIDMVSGSVLWEKNSNKPMYPASTTKIMTALIAMDYIDPADVLKVGDEANRAGIGSSIAGLDYGEEISFEDLMYGLMLPSGNDSAYVLAVNTARIASGNQSMSIDDAIEYFIGMMNQMAHDLGANDTQFKNPDGFHEEGHVTTAYDLALIAKKAMEYVLFRGVISTEHVRIDDYKQFNENDPPYRDWNNTNELIQKGSNYYYEYATGVKTGHTENAGYCLVASAQKDVYGVITVILNSSQESVFTDARTLLDAYFD